MTPMGHQPGTAQTRRPLVVVESPLAPRDGYTFEQNIQLARNACRYAVLAGYSPYASHLFFPQFLNDYLVDERTLGIDAGLDWSRHADEAWFVLRDGQKLSTGMKIALYRHARDSKTIRFYITSNEGRTLTQVQPTTEASDVIGQVRGKIEAETTSCETEETAGSRQSIVAGVIDEIQGQAEPGATLSDNDGQSAVVHGSD